jgi:carbonic anhydrase
MRSLKPLFDSNRAWVADVTREDPGFFDRLAHQQSPQYLWIGCSDSRVPANQITGLMPGEVFVHRNIANVVVHTDLNCLSVIEFAVEVLQVRHVIVCGHYGCSGVHAALTGRKVGLADNWLRHVQDVGDRHGAYLASFTSEARRYDALCDLNVIEQVKNVCQTTAVQNAWGRGRELAVHGWVYGVHDGLLRDLAATVESQAEAAQVLAGAINRLRRGDEP